MMLIRSYQLTAVTKRTLRELRILRHLRHENLIDVRREPPNRRTATAATWRWGNGMVGQSMVEKYELRMSHSHLSWASWCSLGFWNVLSLFLNDTFFGSHFWWAESGNPQQSLECCPQIPYGFCRYFPDSNSHKFYHDFQLNPNGCWLMFI